MSAPDSRRVVRRLSGCASAVLLSVIVLGGCGTDDADTEAGRTMTAPPRVTTGDGPDPTTTDDGDTEQTVTTDEPQPTTTDGDGDDDGDDGDDGPPSTTNEFSVGPAFNAGLPIDFGVVRIGFDRSIELRVVNRPNGGEATRVLEDIRIGGEHESDFEITGGDCEVGTELAPNESCTLEVTFEPTVKGTRNAFLTVSVDVGFDGSRRLKGVGGFLLPTEPDVPIETEPVVTG
jgi:hypothetical protein